MSPTEAAKASAPKSKMEAVKIDQGVVQSALTYLFKQKFEAVLVILLLGFGGYYTIYHVPAQEKNRQDADDKRFDEYRELRNADLTAIKELTATIAEGTASRTESDKENIKVQTQILHYLSELRGQRGSAGTAGP